MGGMVALFLVSLFVLSASAQDMTASFDMSLNHSSNSFRQFVNDLRAMLRVSDRPFVMQDAGRLPPQEDVPTRFMDLVVRTVDHAITLRLRMDNVYVVGFRNGVGEGTWFEFRHNNGMGTVIDGSTPLRFGGDYQPSDGLGTIHENTEVGRSIVESAIDELATHGVDGTEIDDNSLKVWLRTLILHFIESIRFNPVADRVAGLMADVDEASPSGSQQNYGTLGSLEYLIHSWGRLSTYLLTAANDVVQDPEVLARRVQHLANHGLQIHNAFEAAQALGLVLLTNSNRRRQRRSVEDNADHVVAGLTLVEVIEVTIRNIDGEVPGDLYGSISIDDGIDSQQLFDRDWFHIQSVRPGDQAKLTGPGRAMSAADDFTVYLDLMDRDLDLSPDDEVSNGVVVWNSREATSDQYDVVHSRIIEGASGYVELRFAVMTDAAVATVEVVLLDSSEHVYGTITATTSLEDGTSVTIRLLDLSDDESVSVEQGSAIPLQRKVVAVQLCSVMQVGVSLQNRNLVFEDEQIANGFVTFEPARLTGEDSAEVSGEKGRVALRVTWSTWFP